MTIPTNIDLDDIVKKAKDGALVAQIDRQFDEIHGARSLLFDYNFNLCERLDRVFDRKRGENRLAPKYVTETTAQIRRILDEIDRINSFRDPQ